MWLCIPPKMRQMVKQGTLDTDLIQGKASEAPRREGEARVQLLPHRTVRLGDEHVAADVRNSVLPGYKKAGDEECGQGEL